MTFRDDRDALLARLAALEHAAADADELRKRVAELEAQNRALTAEVERLRPPPPPPPPDPPAQTDPRTLSFRITGPKGTRDVSLAKALIKIGRIASAHLQIEDPDASRMHAVVERVGDDVFVIDMGSTTGTLVNGERVNKRALRHGDVIQIGKTQIQIGIG